MSIDKSVIMRILILSILLLISVNAEAKYAGAQVNQIPTASIFPSINAILFPAPVTAAGVNASALGIYGTRTDIQAAYTHPSGSDPTGIFAGTEIGSNGFGVGLGYIGQKGDTSTVNNMYGGFGFKAGTVCLGAGTRVLDTKSGPGPVFDLSMMSGGPTGFNWGIVGYNLLKKAQVDIGVGVGGAKKYNIELNVMPPPITNGEGEGFTITAGATLFGLDWLGLSGRTSYITAPSSFNYMAGATVWFNDTFNSFLFYTSPGFVTGGLSFSF